MSKDTPEAGQPPKNIVPANVIALTKITDTDSHRYAIGGVKVQIADGRYVLAATDTRRLAVVKGPCIDPKDDRQKRIGKAPSSIHANKSLAETAPVDAVIHSSDMRRSVGFSRDKRKYLGFSQNCTTVRIAVDGERSCETPIVEGRFPKYEEVIPKGKPNFVTTVDPRLLAELLLVAAEFAVPRAGIDIEFIDAESPLVLRFTGLHAMKDEQEFIGVIMPLSRDR